VRACISFEFKDSLKLFFSFWLLHIILIVFFEEVLISVGVGMRVIEFGVDEIKSYFCIVIVKRL
jgi:hypothetical protein